MNDEENAVEVKSGTGRWYTYRRDFSVPIPSDWALPTEVATGELCLTLEESEQLQERLRPVYLKWQADHVSTVVERIRSVFPGLTLREIERACGVTSTYLSHVMASRKEAGQPLLNLLEAFALYPEELERKRAESKSTENRSFAEAWDRKFQGSAIVAALSSFRPGTYRGEFGSSGTPESLPTVRPIAAPSVSEYEDAKAG